MNPFTVKIEDVAPDYDKELVLEVLTKYKGMTPITWRHLSFDTAVLRVLAFILGAKRTGFPPGLVFGRTSQMGRFLLANFPPEHRIYRYISIRGVDVHHRTAIVAGSGIPTPIPYTR